ncbi:hypothetical protein TYRP_017365 [Tyrophagus putrescentiae]|nr:hypothetical protein TYRP_017365 [Tyrophagus putrescentiae]
MILLALEQVLLKVRKVVGEEAHAEVLRRRGVWRWRWIELGDQVEGLEEKEAATVGEQHSQVVGRQRKVHRAAGPLILVLIFRGKLIRISRIKEGEGVGGGGGGGGGGVMPNKEPPEEEEEEYAVQEPPLPMRSRSSGFHRLFSLFFALLNWQRLAKAGEDVLIQRQKVVLGKGQVEELERGGDVVHRLLLVGEDGRREAGLGADDVQDGGRRAGQRVAGVGGDRLHRLPGVVARVLKVRRLGDVHQVAQVRPATLGKVETAGRKAALASQRLLVAGVGNLLRQLPQPRGAQLAALHEHHIDGDLLVVLQAVDQQLAGGRVDGEDAVALQRPQRSLEELQGAVISSARLNVPLDEVGVEGAAAAEDLRPLRPLPALRVDVVEVEAGVGPPQAGQQPGDRLQATLVGGVARQRVEAAVLELGGGDVRQLGKLPRTLQQHRLSGEDVRREEASQVVGHRLVDVDAAGVADGGKVRLQVGSIHPPHRLLKLLPQAHHPEAAQAAHQVGAGVVAEDVPHRPEADRRQRVLAPGVGAVVGPLGAQQVADEGQFAGGGRDSGVVVVVVVTEFVVIFRVIEGGGGGDEGEMEAGAVVEVLLDSVVFVDVVALLSSSEPPSGSKFFCGFFGREGFLIAWTMFRNSPNSSLSSSSPLKCWDR